MSIWAEWYIFYHILSQNMDLFLENILSKNISTIVLNIVETL